jgi:hypothetical protein
LRSIRFLWLSQTHNSCGQIGIRFTELHTGAYLGIWRWRNLGQIYKENFESFDAF